MIQKVINEITNGLNHGLYLISLSAALTLPDVCGKAEYPNEKTSIRYKKWYSTFVIDGNLPADSVYALRCSLLHEGNTEPEDKNRIQFQLMTNQYTKPLGIELCFHVDIKRADGTKKSTVTVYVGYLCTAICKAANHYYNHNKEKFNFLNYSIKDIAQDFEVLKL